MDHDVPGLAAELSYQFMFATFPFVIFLAALAGFISRWLGIDDPSGRIIESLGRELPADLVGPIKDQLEAVLAHTDPQLLSLGAVLALWASVGGMNTLMKAMNRAHSVPESRSLPVRLAVSVTLTVTLGAAIVVSFVAVVGGTLATHHVIEAVGLGGIWPALALLRWPISFFLLVAAVATLLRYAPSVRTPWRWVGIAAVAFAIVWLAVTYTFGLYVAQFASFDATYGALAAAVVLMLWFYLSSFILVCAAEVAALLVRRAIPVATEFCLPAHLERLDSRRRGEPASALNGEGRSARHHRSRPGVAERQEGRGAGPFQRPVDRRLPCPLVRRRDRRRRRRGECAWSRPDTVTSTWAGPLSSESRVRPSAGSSPGSW